MLYVINLLGGHKVHVVWVAETCVRVGHVFGGHAHYVGLCSSQQISIFTFFFEPYKVSRSRL